jgi:poly(A) polymerase
MYLQAAAGLELSVEPSISSLLARVSHFLTEQRVRAYLTGGLVRDARLGRETADIDIAVSADALEVARQIAVELGGRYVPLDEENGIGRVVLERLTLDFTTFRDDIEDDLARRDFTIDAMAIDLEEFVRQPRSATLIDPFRGQDDLDKGIIRAVTETAFPSDPVRLLRAVRLAAELGFSVDGETEALIRQSSSLIGRVAGERVREELLRLLTIPKAGQFLAYLDKLGLLMAVIPEMVETRDVEQPKEHFWDVLTHSIKTVDAVDFLLRQGAWEYAGDEVLALVPWTDELEQHFNREVSRGSTRGAMVKLAALLHDIAKPQTKAFDESGRMRFLGHAGEGAEAAAGILERLRFSAKEIKLVELLVKNHLRPTQMSQEGLPSRRAIYRYFRDTGETGIDVFFLSLADHLATRGPTLDLTQWKEHAATVAYVLTRHFEEETLTVPPKLIDGYDIMKCFGLSPGPRIGELLEAVREAQAEGEVTSREEALAYLESFLSSHPAGK